MVDLIGRTAIRNNRQENERFFEIMIQKFMIFLNLILNLISEFNCLIFLIKIKIKSNFLKLKSWESKKKYLYFDGKGYVTICKVTKIVSDVPKIRSKASILANRNFIK